MKYLAHASEEGVSVFVLANWRPHVGDPTIAGWSAAVGYGLSALFCAVAAKRCSKSFERRFWVAGGVVLAILGVNKHLDLQTLLTLQRRALATAQGWAGARRQVQLIVLSLLALTGAAAVTALVRSLRKAAPPIRTALLGFALLGAFVLGRASLFYHFTSYGLLSRITAAGVEAVELLEIAVVALSAAAFSAYIRR